MPKATLNYFEILPTTTDSKQSKGQDRILFLIHSLVFCVSQKLNHNQNENVKSGFEFTHDWGVL